MCTLNASQELADWLAGCLQSNDAFHTVIRNVHCVLFWTLRIWPGCLVEIFRGWMISFPCE